MKFNFLIASLLLLSISSVHAAEKTQWTCLSANKTVSIVITHAEGAYVAEGLVTIVNIQVPMPCTSNATHSAYVCMENNDQVERLGAVIGSSVEGQFSGYVLINNKLMGIQKFADVTCTKTI